MYIKYSYYLLVVALSLFFSVFLFSYFGCFSVIADELHVSSLDQLKSAVNDNSAQLIYLDNDIDFPANSSSSIPINRNVVIDGQGHIITNEGDMTKYYGLYFNQSNITITVRNVKFGDDSTNKSFSNYWGIVYGDGDHQNLNIENISYFSNYYAQPFWLQNKTSIITFSGENNFEQEPGIGTQEWAEASNFIFKKNSKTTINHNTTEEGGFIWSSSGLNLTIEDSATVNITTNHYFSWSSSYINDIVVGKNSNLTINDTVQPIARYNYTYNFTVGANSKLSIYTNRSSGSGEIKGLFKFDKNSIGEFKTGGTSFFNSASGIKYMLNCPKSILFESQYIKQTSQNPIGLEGNSNINFTEIPKNSAGYGIIADNKQIDIQKTTDYWSVFNSGITRANNDFSEENKSALNNAKSIKLERLESLKFDGNGGTPIIQEKSIATDTVAKFNDLDLNIPSKKDFIFEGWSTIKNDVSTKIDRIKVPFGGQTIYALWSPNYIKIKQIDNFNFGKHMISDKNIIEINASIIIDDNLNSNLNSGWQLTLNYNSQDESTKKWISGNFDLLISPKTDKSFVHPSEAFKVSSEPHLVAIVSNESEKDKYTEQIIYLTPKIISYESLKQGSYHAELIWNVSNVPN